MMLQIMWLNLWVSPTLTQFTFIIPNNLTLAIINHSNQEFVIDFVAALPGLPQARVNNRQILSPESAKRLLFALQENVVNFEQQFGTIQLGGAPEGAQSPEGIGRTATPFGLPEGNA